MSDKKKQAWLKNPKDLLRTILQLNDSPHSIALGVAIGMFIGLTPTVGIQMLMVVCFAFLTKPFFYFNRVAAIITVYISNPLTVVPIYYGLYWVGTLFVGGSATRDDFTKILDVSGIREAWTCLVDMFVAVGEPLLIGTAIVATVGGLLTYPIMYCLLVRFRSAHPVLLTPTLTDPKVQEVEEQDSEPQSEVTPAPPSEKAS